MSLRVYSRAFVLTSSGEREIQLCLGDITTLSTADKVDILAISAFQSDYIPVKNTVIGALWYKLNLSVRELAKDKHEDLRKLFNCWISKPLPTELPYGQILCFERKYNDSSPLHVAVKEVFRGLMPIFNRANRSVIMPLLATGNQNGDPIKMLESLVSSAVEWMRMGLSLQTLKIVIYETKPDRFSCNVNKICAETFIRMKKSIEANVSLPKEPDIKYDVFIVFSKCDENLSETLISKIKKENKAVIAINADDVANKPNTWQHDVFIAMISSKRVVPLLDKAFLECTLCVDQYNIALCCNRYVTKRHILAPLRLEHAEFPLYMGMVQWITSGPSEAELSLGASVLIHQIETIKKQSTIQKDSYTYDVFLSYCHKNSGTARLVLDVLRENDESLRIFFDYDTLKTGVSWQKELYDALDCSRCVLAIGSQEYFESSMCNEEYNIATAKYLSDVNFELIVLKIDDSFNHVSLEALDGYDSPFVNYIEIKSSDASIEMANLIAEGIIDYVRNKNRNESIFKKNRKFVDLNKISRERESAIFKRFYTFKDAEFSLDQSAIVDYIQRMKKNNETIEYSKTSLGQQKRNDGRSSSASSASRLRRRSAKVGVVSPNQDASKPGQTSTTADDRQALNTTATRGGAEVRRVHPTTSPPRVATLEAPSLTSSRDAPQVPWDLCSIKDNDSGIAPTPPLSSTSVVARRRSKRNKSSGLCCFGGGGDVVSSSSSVADEGIVEAPLPSALRTASRCEQDCQSVLDVLNIQNRNASDFDDTLGLVSNCSTICVRPKMAATPCLPPPLGSTSCSQSSSSAQRRLAENSSPATPISTTPTSADDLVNDRVTACEIDVFLSCTPSDRRFASAVQKLLHHIAPSLVVTLSAGDISMDDLENCAHFLVLLSNKYLLSPYMSEQFQLILTKQRSTKRQIITVLSLEETLTASDTYLQILASQITHLHDDTFKSLGDHAKLSEFLESLLIRGNYEDDEKVAPDDLLPLYKVAIDIGNIFSDQPSLLEALAIGEKEMVLRNPVSLIVEIAGLR